VLVHIGISPNVAGLILERNGVRRLAERIGAMTPIDLA
jgi:hypothetical protein